MPRYKLTIEYAGTRYSGWQIQKNAKTVQGALDRAIQDAIGSSTFETYGAGRTDAGVHALHQVAHLDTASTLAPASLTTRSIVTHGDARDSESLANDENRQDFARAVLYEGMQDEIVDTAFQACDCQYAFPGNPNGIDVNASVVANLTAYLNAATTAFNGSFYTVGYSDLSYVGPPVADYIASPPGNRTYCNGTGTLNLTLTLMSNTTNTRAIRQESAMYQYNLTRNEEATKNLEIEVKTYQGQGPTLRSQKTVRVTC